jgi:hypothetical protein
MQLPRSLGPTQRSIKTSPVNKQAEQCPMHSVLSHVAVCSRFYRARRCMECMPIPSAMQIHSPHHATPVFL